MVFDNQSQQARETWYALREFETRDITARSFEKRHSLQPSAKKVRQISSNFIQAREYFRSASAADFTVRPLLQYYGVASLSRGITLFLNVDSRESTLKQGHGLETIRWSETLSDGLNNTGNLGIRVSGGTFHDLLLATGNKFYFRHNTSAVSWFVGASVPEPSSVFTFSEIAARVPGLKSQYLAWTEDRSVEMTTLNSFKRDDGNGLFEFKVPLSGEPNIDALFPQSSYSYREIERNSDSVVVKINQAAVPFFAQSTGVFNIGNVVLYPNLDSGIYFTPLAAGYMASYILGMLCRYFPTSWISASRSEKGDAVYPLVTRMLDWIQDTYPAMIVDILRGPYDFETDE